MNSKKLKHQKRPKKGRKTKTENGETEIFVLPPHLLKKLGINLESVDNTQKCPTEATSKSGSATLNSLPVLPLNNDATKINPVSTIQEVSSNSTILETANLMKKSVFLSPSFIDNSDFIDPSEVDSVGDKEGCGIEIIRDSIGTAERVNVIPPQAAIMNQVSPLELEKLPVIIDQQQNGYQPSDNETQPRSTNIPDSKFIMPSNNNATDIDDHPDEAYSSDCSNLGSLETGDAPNCIIDIHSFGIQKINGNNRKINIISEEILNPIQIKKLKSLHAAKISEFIPVSLNSAVLTDSPIAEIENNSTIQKLNNVKGESHKNLETIVLYDEEGIAIQTVSSDGSPSTQDTEMNKSSFFIVNDAQIEISPNAYTSQVSQEIHNEYSKSDVVPENNFGVCIDFAVTDIEMHLKENEDTLDNFFNEITSNDSDEILAKIEKSEEECFAKAINEGSEVVQIVTNNNNSLDIFPKNINECQGSNNVEDKECNNEVDKNNENVNICSYETDTDCTNFTTRLENLKHSAVHSSEVECNMKASKANQEFGTNKKEPGILSSKFDTADIKENLKQNRESDDQCVSQENILAKEEKDVSEKIKEIAVYLRQFAENRSKCIKVKPKLCTGVEFPAKKPNQYPFKSKLHIQGVEKPGGLEQSEKNKKVTNIVKTYTRPNRPNKNRHVVVIPASMIEPQVGQSITNYLKIEDYDLTIANCTKTYDFCLCADFGKLTYYDSDCLYEHIHFWEHKNIDCNPDSLFNIDIDDSYTLSDSKQDEYLEKNENEDIEVIDYSICWHTLERNCTNVEKSCDNDKLSESDRKLVNDKPQKHQPHYIMQPKNTDYNAPNYFAVTTDGSSNQSKIVDSSSLEDKDRFVQEFPTCANIKCVASNNKSAPEESEGDSNIQEIKKKRNTTDQDKVASNADVVDLNQCNLQTSRDMDEENTNENGPETKAKDSSSLEDKDRCVQEFPTCANIKCVASSNKIAPEESEGDSNIQEIKKKRNTTDEDKVASNADVVDLNQCNLQISRDMDEENTNKNGPETKAKDSSSLEDKDRCVQEFPTSVNIKCVASSNKIAPEESGGDSNIQEIKKKRNITDELKVASDINLVDLNQCNLQTSRDMDEENTNKNGPETKAKDSSSLEDKDRCVQEFPTCANIKCVASSNKIAPEESEGDSNIQEIKKKRNITDELKVASDINLVDLNQCNLQTSRDMDEENTNKNGPETKAKKRKIMSNSIAKDEDNDEPISKKPIKCGVCKTVLAESEWDEHASKEHHFIAWRSGNTFDFEIPELSEKLKAVLEKTNSLKCTFCYTEHSNVKMFLIHVQKCFRMKDANNTTPVTEVNRKQEDNAEEDKPSSNVIKCALCKEDIESSGWMEHIAREHNYLAWADGEDSLDLESDEDIRIYLNDIIREIGELKCSKCGIVRKYAKLFLKHIRNCKGDLDESKESTNNDDIVTETRRRRSWSCRCELAPSPTICVKCGVCSQDIENLLWIDHIAKEHEYLAWKDGDPPLDVDNKESVWQQLRSIARVYGKLICNKCGFGHKYPKAYLLHVKNCSGNPAPMDDSLNESASSSVMPKADDTSDVSVTKKSRKSKATDTELVKCGVCQKEVLSGTWIQHIERQHNYLAWKEGESLNLNDEEEVQNHLYAIAKIKNKEGGLRCKKCGILRKYVKNYLSHIETCKAKIPDYDENAELNDEKILECAVCSEKVLLKDWYNHKMKKHYNVAWWVGDVPIDFRNAGVVERLVKEYRDRYKRLVCKECGGSRVSCMGFYAHVITCNKTEEEVDVHKALCELCNKKYLCVYQSQHMKWHRDQEQAKEKKLRDLENQQEKLKAHTENIEEEEGLILGPRKAAKKARTVIEQYKTQMGQYSCSTCGFGSDSKEDLDKHLCMIVKIEEGSDSEDSVMLVDGEDESADSDIDSNISDEEDLASKRRHKDYIPASLKIPRILFKPSNVNGYLIKSGEEFCEFHFTSDKLFPELATNNYEPIPEDQMSMYMPPLTESCYVKFSEPVWTTYKLFEAKQSKGRNQSIFVGACIQSVSWVPPVADDEDSCDNYLAVVTHRGVDYPRVNIEHTPAHPGLIQIWDFGQFEESPNFVLGLAHDFGVAWAVDWCPSGARDLLPETVHSNSTLRLGLLAAACSNGNAYIFSVPYPVSVVKNGKLIVKMKPVAELRLSMRSNRKMYQATSISWSPQKNHDCIVVGYADGTTAYFDLNTESPFLKTKDKDVTIFYPYHDERPHNTCITGVAIYPSADSVSVAGAVCTASLTGSSLIARPGSLPTRQYSRMVGNGACFQPLWPAAALSGDDASSLSSPNEIEWFGGGRRLGSASAMAACVRCARVALAAPPLLRIVRPHPVVPDYKKHVIGILQMTPRGKKRRKLANDELQVKVEPLTYENAINKYGIELKCDKETVSQQSIKLREQFPERFPLADVTSMAFCPSATHHGKLAIATHAGIVFILHV